MHVGAWEPLTLDVNVRVVVFELGDERVVPVALLAGVAMQPIVITYGHALRGRGRFGSGGWRSSCWGRGRRWCSRRRWLGCRRWRGWGSRRRSRRWYSAATTGAQNRRSRNTAEYQGSAPQHLGA